MALTIILTTGTNKEWHVGEPNPIKWSQVDFVRSIQADGHELQHIKNMFDNSMFQPIPNGQVIRLFGDFAKTIVGNL